MNFFVTGNELFAAGIDLKFIASTKSHGANFSRDEKISGVPSTKGVL